jgi:hypothetical protein
MFGKTWTLMLIAGPFVLAMIALAFCPIYQGTGFTDLEIEFLVEDAATHAPIPGALIDVQSFTGNADHTLKTECVLMTDESGLARTTTEAVFDDSSSLLGIASSFSVNPPNWVLRVSAPEYATNELLDLHSPACVRKSAHTGPHKSKLQVRVSLQKK